MNFITNADNPTKPVNLDTVITYYVRDNDNLPTYDIVFVGSGGPSVVWNFALEATRDAAKAAVDAEVTGTPTP